MHANQLRGAVFLAIQNASRGALATASGSRTQNSAFGQRLSNVGTPTAGTAAGTAGAAIPGGSVIANALGSALGGVFGGIRDGVADIEHQLKANPDLTRRLPISGELAQLRNLLDLIKAKAERQR